MSETEKPDAGQPLWRTRTLILLAVGMVAAWLVWWIVDFDSHNWANIDPALMSRRTALSTGVAVAALAFGFGLERVRMRWTAIFAVVLGLIAGLVVFWNNSPEGLWDWSGASLFLAIAIALPLFQVARDEGRWSFPYTQIHGHAWTNVVLWFACWAFVGIAMMLTYLLSELFRLIGIDLIYDLLQNHGWFAALIIGGAFGAALGMLRDLDHVVRLLQRVVTIVLSVFAPVLAFGLILFLLSLPFTGLGRLWEATRSTTPILISCVIGALILINAVVGHGPGDEAKNPVLRWAAMALGFAILPLAIIASIATGLRINQYGFTPDRLWALVVVVLATTYGLVYLVALARKRQNWAVQLRPDNIRLAFATMVLALVLATPLIGFNAISADSQVARLESGKVNLERFDWPVLAFKFGQPGRDALDRLKRSTNPAIRAKATEVASAKTQYDLPLTPPPAPSFAGHYDIRPAGTQIPEALKVVIESNACHERNLCRVYLVDDKTAIVIDDSCVLVAAEKKYDPNVCAIDRRTYALNAKGWEQIDSGFNDFAPTAGAQWDAARAANKRRQEAVAAGQVTVRKVERRQVFIGDEPQGDVFE